MTFSNFLTPSSNCPRSRCQGPTFGTALAPSFAFREITLHPFSMHPPPAWVAATYILPYPPIVCYMLRHSGSTVNTIDQWILTLRHTENSCRLCMGLEKAVMRRVSGCANQAFSTRAGEGARRLLRICIPQASLPPRLVLSSSPQSARYLEPGICGRIGLLS